MEKLIVTNTITIQAPASKVWDILINPQQTKKYMFGCETVSDWTIGSLLLWRAKHEGKETIYVKGHITALEPEKYLAYTVFDPHGTIPDILENYLTVAYTLSEETNNQTVLTVTQGDYNTVADGERRYNEANNNGEGWNPILVQIKKIAEDEE